MADPKDLEFLAVKSKDLVDKQIASYRQKHTNASSIIAIVALFIPLFLSGLDEAYNWIKWASLLPVALFVIAICILLFHVLRSQPLYQALSFSKFQDLVNLNNYEQVLLYEIGANKSSFEDNETISDSTNKYFNRAIVMTIFAIVLSVALLLINKFNKPHKKKEPVQVEIIKRVLFTDSSQASSDQNKRIND